MQKIRHLITDSPVESAETEVKQIIISHSPSDRVAYSFFLYKGDKKRIDTAGHGLTWELQQKSKQMSF